MNARVLSQNGNVIAADFGNRTSLGLSFTQEIIYQDDAVMMFRVSYWCNGKPISKMPTQHFLFDLHTGRHVTL